MNRNCRMDIFLVEEIAYDYCIVKNMALCPHVNNDCKNFYYTKLLVAGLY